MTEALSHPGGGEGLSDVVYWPTLEMYRLPGTNQTLEIEEMMTSSAHLELFRELENLLVDSDDPNMTLWDLMHGEQFKTALSKAGQLLTGHLSDELKSASRPELVEAYQTLPFISQLIAHSRREHHRGAVINASFYSKIAKLMMAFVRIDMLNGAFNPDEEKWQKLADSLYLQEDHDPSHLEQNLQRRIDNRHYDPNS